MPPKQSKVTKNYLLFASNCLEWSVNTANRAFSLATPIDHTYQCHMLFPLHMLDHKIGKGCWVITSVSTSIHTRHYTNCTAAYPGRQGAMARGVCALESSSVCESISCECGETCNPQLIAVLRYYFFLTRVKNLSEQLLTRALQSTYPARCIYINLRAAGAALIYMYVCWWSLPTHARPVVSMSRKHMACSRYGR